MMSDATQGSILPKGVNQARQSGGRQFQVRLAEGADDLRAVQALRYDVFVAEMGSDGPGVDHGARREADRFDDVSRHLMLWDGPQLAGVYRVLDRDGAARAGGFYSASEYDLTPILNDGRPVLELGRSCVAKPYRNGPALLHLWQGLAALVKDEGIGLLFGVASFPGTDVDELAAPLSLLHHHHRIAANLRPKAIGAGRVAMDRVPEDQIDRKAALRQVPSLIKSYLRIGGGVGDGAFVDRAFNTIDVAMVLDVDAMSPQQQSLYHRGKADE